ncbi:cofilin [Aspergillus carlsbadensis]|nr:cofilin [Aspergillus carlsbadensis]
MTTVDDDCVAKFQDLKVKGLYKYIIFGLNSTNSSIIVHKTSSDEDYDTFLADLPETECRWAVYDFHYTTDSGDKKKLLFYYWSPEAARVREKMLYSSARDTLRKALVGISAEIQGTEPAEVSYETALEKAKKR